MSSRGALSALLAATAACVLACSTAMADTPLTSAGSSSVITGDDFYNIGGQLGFTPFTCPTGAPADCGARLYTDPQGENSFGTYEFGFQLGEGDGLPNAAGNDTITLTGPPGVDFSHATFTIGWGGTERYIPRLGYSVADPGCWDPQTPSGWYTTPDYGNGYINTSSGNFTFYNEGCTNTANVKPISASGNVVTIPVPSGFAMTVGGPPAVVTVSDVINPPEGSYSGGQWTVAATDPGAGDYSAGPEQIAPNVPLQFSAGPPFADNTTLSADPQTVPVSTDQGPELTTTVRDEAGNPVSGAPVLIEPEGGNASLVVTSGSPTANGIAQTGSDGTVSEEFSDTVAQPVTFQSSYNPGTGQGFVVPETPQVTFTPGPPVVANSFIALAGCTGGCGSGNQVSTAGGQADVLIALADQYGNPDLGDEVLLSPQARGEFVRGVTSPMKSSCPAGSSTPSVPGAGCAINPLFVGSRMGSSSYTAASAEFQVSDPKVEDVPFTVDDLTSGTTLSLTPPGVPPGPGTPPFALDFVAGPPATSSVVASRSQDAADGTSTDTITVSLADANGNPISGLSVSLSAGAGSHATLSGSPSTTNAAGQAQFTVTDAAVEKVEFTASYSGTILGQSVSGSVSGSATVDFVAGPTSSASSTLTATPATVKDDGQQAATVTVTLLDAEGHAAAGRQVTLEGTSGTGSLITPVAISDARSGCPTQASPGTTDCHGQARFEVTDTNPETVTYSAVDAGSGTIVDQRASVTFSAPPSPATSTLSAAPATVIADGSTTATVTVLLKDASGNPVSGRQVCLTQTTAALATDDCATQAATTPSSITAQSSPAGSCAGAPPAAGTTNCDGQATFEVSATSPGTVTYGVIDTTDDGPDGALLGPFTQVTFTRAQSEQGQSSVMASPSTALAATAGPDGTSTVTVTLLSAAGTPLSGHQVTLSASSPHATVTPVASPATGCNATSQPGTSDCNGAATFSVSDADTEVVTFTATDATSGSTILQKATVVFRPDEAANATVSASPTSVLANDGLTGAGVAIVSVELDPQQPQADAGNIVSLSQPSGDHATVIPQGRSAAATGCPAAARAGTADCHGEVTFAVSDGTPETVVFTAIDDTTGVPLTQTATLSFTPIAPIVQGVAPDTGPLAGGTTVTIHGVGLSYGNAVPVVTVAGRRATRVQCVANDSCTAVIPAGHAAGTAIVEVSTAIGTSSAAANPSDQYSYLVGRPRLLHLTPSTGPTSGGTIVTLTGRNLEGASAVSFGSTRVVVRHVNAGGTRLTVRAPAELPGTVQIRVTTPAGVSSTSNKTRFKYRAGLTKRIPTFRRGGHHAATR